MITVKKLLLPGIMLIFCCKAGAQTTPDTAIVNSKVKTLSDVEYSALLHGEDLSGMSLAGEMNGFPLPDKALKFKDELGLSKEQVTKLTAMAKELRRKKLEMGLIIINNERTLDSIFRYNRLDNGSLIFFTNRYGLYQGELRNAILQACLATKTLLSPQQLKWYKGLHKAN
jgi:hypothetical protein